MQNINFEVTGRDGLARTAKFKTLHGVIETPTLLPVINPNISTLKIGEMTALGAQAFITNSYIIRRNEKLREKAEKHGVHSLIDFNGPIMTDSGTFQSHVYSDVEYTNLEIVDFQRKIGSDISTILDIFSEPDFSHERAKNAVLETHSRMMQLPEDIEDTIIAGPIQGSLYNDLRKMSAELMSSSQAGYLPIGGVVPLLENYRYDALVDIIINSKLNAGFSKPIHLFGGGHPMFMSMAVLLGVDLFDSASYVKYARDGRMLFSDGSKELSRISSLPRWSPIYGKVTVQEMKEMPPEQRSRMLSLHNLGAIFNELHEIRERIFQQTLWQYVEMKARSHPYLFKAYRRILEYSEVLEKYEDLSKKSSFFFFDRYTDRTPYIRRLESFSEKLRAKSGKDEIVLGEEHWHPGRPHQESFKTVYEHSERPFMLQWQDSLVPLELDETYPVEQLITSGFREEGKLNDTTDLSKIRQADGEIRNFDLEKVRRVADYQFGIGYGERLFPENTRVTRSRKTGRIRGVYLDGKLLGTLRAHDGFFTLGVEGARRLHQIAPFPEHRIVVTEDSAEFNSKGFNVFFKFITGNYEGITAGNEVLVVDPGDHLAAVGKSVLSGLEIPHFKSGVAVKVHKGILQGEDKEESED